MIFSYHYKEDMEQLRSTIKRGNCQSVHIDVAIRMTTKVFVTICKKYFIQPVYAEEDNYGIFN